MTAGLNVDGATTMDALTADGNADINGNLDVDGATIDLSATGVLNLDADETYIVATEIIDLHGGTSWLHVSDDGQALYNTTGSEVSMASDMIYMDAPAITLDGDAAVTGTLDVDGTTELDGLNVDGATTMLSLIQI